MARRGYTEAGYPIVWKRWAKKALESSGALAGLDAEAVEKVVHDACLKKLAEQPLLSPEKPEAAPKAKAQAKPPKGRTLKTYDVSVSADAHQFILNFGGRQSFHPTLADVGTALLRKISVEKVRAAGEIRDLHKLVSVANEASIAAASLVAQIEETAKALVLFVSPVADDDTLEVLSTTIPDDDVADFLSNLDDKEA